jgi:group II intron reverse transcriptase/maturase
MKNVLEPIFEADFFPVSYGFRPGKSVHGALEHLRVTLRPKEYRRKAITRGLPYQWAVEGDIKGCFDNIDHHALMCRVRRRVADPKTCRLLVAFLKAGALSEEQFSRSEAGTPQGGILSPLLANIALSAIEERYARHVWPARIPTRRRDAATPERRAENARHADRASGRPIVFPIRYADDFLLLVGVAPGPDQDQRAREAALREKADLATFLKEQLSLELSETKTLVTPVTTPIRFLGHQVRVRRHPLRKEMVSTAVIPKERSQRLRDRIKDLFRYRTVGRSLNDRLRQLNPMLRGWCNFYRHAWGAKHVFKALDHYLWWTIFRWLRKKHRRVPLKRLLPKYGRRRPSRRSLLWADGGTVLYEMQHVSVRQYRLCWERLPDFAMPHGEPGA